MSFDKDTRNILAKTVAACRRRLTEDVIDQLRGVFGLHPDGTVLALEEMTHLSPDQTAAARRLRDLLDHYTAGAAGGDKDRRKAAYERMTLEISFTILNRLAALRLCEERGLVIECVRKGTASDGFRLFERISGGALGGRYDTYRVFLECLFDELALDLGVLFDRMTPQSAVFPSERCMEDVLAELNKNELTHLWTEDETIGWVYQYFNPPEERRAMRDASQAPRNSRELAVRNQFFTPRYVVEFLTDNTLGRIWYEMRKGDTALKDECRYLVRRPNEVFLASGEKAPPSEENESDLSQEELLKKPVYIEHRPKKDPRDLRVLDPACGSGHFLLYAFDLLERIYEEAWEEQWAAVSGQWSVDSEGDSENEGAKLQGPDSLEESHGLGGAGLSGDQEFSTGRGLRTDQPNQKSGGVNSIEHRGGTRTELNKGVPQSSVDSIRVASGGGNPGPVGAASGLPGSEGSGSDFEPGGGSGTIDQRSVSVALKKVGYDHEKPTTDHRPLITDFPTREVLRRAVPKLIIEHNLHGIDIDPRAVQIAALALWLRAQKTWKNLGIKAAERPQVTKSNIVTAEPMPGEEDMKEEFTAGLKPRVLGQLVDVVFDKMKLAGEAGSLLKIEEEIKDAVAEAKEEYRKELRLRKEEAGYLPGMAPERAPTLFDFADMSDQDFLDQAEDGILAALKDYAERAENGRAVRRRLFAEDAARGFAFIDLCRKRFDVVLMNPPFGDAAVKTRAYLKTFYSEGSHDICAAFVLGFAARLAPKGKLGAITTRLALFIQTFAAWRQLLLSQHRFEVVADLGYGVLDAMVETAMYTVAHESLGRGSDTAFLGLLNSTDKEISLNSSFLNQSQEIDWKSSKSFESVPGQPLAYWVPSSLLAKFTKLESFNKRRGSIRQGIATADDFRFLRLRWEIPRIHIFYGDNSKPSSLSPCWVPMSKGGEYSPWWDDIHLALKWHNNGSEVRNFFDDRGKLRSRPQNLESFFLEGATFAYRTTSAFGLRYMPPGCAFSVGGWGVFPPDTFSLYETLAIYNTRIARYFMEVLLGQGDASVSGTAARNHGAEAVGGIPWPDDHLESTVHGAVTQLVELWAELNVDETCSNFVAPACLTETNSTLQEAARQCWLRRCGLWRRAAKLHMNVEGAVAKAYGLSASEMKAIATEEGESLSKYTCGEMDQEVLARLFSASVEALTDEARQVLGAKRYVVKKAFFIDRVIDLACHMHHLAPESIIEAAEQITPEKIGYHKSITTELISWMVGSLYGRWDINVAKKNAIGGKQQGVIGNFFKYPPGMLLDERGRPASSNDIESSYPLRVSWDGILVDDPGFDGGQPHRDDIVRRVREVLDLLWKDKAYEIEQEACDILGVPALRDYFRKPAGFFQDHLNRYSKSRRKAPVYWPISTASGSYTLWLYYHRLTDQTLYAAVNKYVEPKITEVERCLTRIEDDLKTASGRDATRLRDLLTEAQSFLGELRDLREELLRIAGLPYKPNLNDGVIINAAPLHNLFRLRTWANDTKKVWGKLEKGDCDWAHLAYTIWPERVRDVCRKDRSIAGAHGLEDICEVEAPAPKKRGGRSRRKKEES